MTQQCPQTPLPKRGIWKRDRFEKGGEKGLILEYINSDVSARYSKTVVRKAIRKFHLDNYIGGNNTNTIKKICQEA